MATHFCDQVICYKTQKTYLQEEIFVMAIGSCKLYENFSLVYNILT